MSQSDNYPGYNKQSFTCPRCGAFSAMKWQHLLLNGNEYSPVSMSICHGCNQPSVWLKNESSPRNTLSALVSKGTLIFPNSCAAPMTEPDMPENIKSDFEEARLVFQHSPRAAAALLRLCVQKLCQTLLGKEGNIHNQIGELVELGFPKRALTAFDTIRIFGNESVHPGTVDLNDTPDVALSLFRLLNMAVRHCITEENELKSIRALTPVGKRREIGE